MELWRKLIQKVFWHRECSWAWKDKVILIYPSVNIIMRWYSMILKVSTFEASKVKKTDTNFCSWSVGNLWYLMLWDVVKAMDLAKSLIKSDISIDNEMGLGVFTFQNTKHPLSRELERNFSYRRQFYNWLQQVSLNLENSWMFWPG